MNNMNSYEINQTSEIINWEKEKPSVLSQASGVITKPIGWLVGKIVPRRIIEGAITTCNATGSLLANKGDIIKDAGISTIDELRGKNLELSDALANGVHNWAIGIASAEGGAAGVAGPFGLAVDIPALLTLAYRTMHKIGMCYGYECCSEQDKMFLNHIMAIASSNTVKEKAAALVALKQIQVMIARTTWRKMAEKAAANKYGPEAFVLLIKQVAKSLGKNITRRKALQAIPVIGVAVGAAMNASFINDVAWAARRSFQKRWLIDNGKIEVN